MKQQDVYIALDWLKPSLDETCDEVASLLLSIETYDKLAEVSELIHQISGTLILTQLTEFQLLSETLEHYCAYLQEQQKPLSETRDVLQAINLLKFELHEMHVAKKKHEGVIQQRANFLRRKMGLPALTKENEVHSLNHQQMVPQSLNHETTLNAENLKTLNQAWRKQTLGLIDNNPKAVGNLIKLADYLRLGVTNVSKKALWHVAHEWLACLQLNNDVDIQASVHSVVRLNDFIESSVEAEQADVLIVDMMIHTIGYAQKTDAAIDLIEFFSPLSNQSKSSRILDRVSAALAEIAEKSESDIGSIYDPLLETKWLLEVGGWQLYQQFVQNVLEAVKPLKNTGIAEEEKWQIQRQLNELIQAIDNTKKLLGNSPNFNEDMVDEAKHAVIREVRVDIEKVKAIFNGYCLSRSLPDLEQIPELLVNAKGAFKMLELNKASDILAKLKELFTKIITANIEVLDWQEIDAIADGIAGLEYYFDRVVQHYRDESILEQAEQSLALAESLLNKNIAKPTSKESVLDRRKSIPDDVTHYDDTGALIPDVAAEQVANTQVANVAAVAMAASAASAAVVASNNNSVEDDREIQIEEDNITDTGFFDFSDVSLDHISSEAVSSEAMSSEAVSSEAVSSEAVFTDEPMAEIQDDAVTQVAESVDKNDESLESDYLSAEDDLSTEGDVLVEDAVAESDTADDTDALFNFDEVIQKTADGTVVGFDAQQVQDDVWEDIESADDDLNFDDAPSVPVTMTATDEMVVLQTKNQPSVSDYPLDELTVFEDTDEVRKAILLIVADDFDQDETIKEIYIEEAEEVLEHIGRYFPLWQSDMSDMQSLTEIRRAFHTLKGSGRMVGANQAGEVAWAIENMLNRVLEKSIVSSEDMVALVHKVTDIFPVFVEDFSHSRLPRLSPVVSIVQANNLMSGKPLNQGLPALENTVFSQPNGKEINKDQSIQINTVDSAAYETVAVDDDVLAAESADELAENVVATAEDLEFESLDDFSDFDDASQAVTDANFDAIEQTEQATTVDNSAEAISEDNLVVADDGIVEQFDDDFLVDELIDETQQIPAVADDAASDNADVSDASVVTHTQTDIETDAEKGTTGGILAGAAVAGAVLAGKVFDDAPVVSLDDDLDTTTSLDFSDTDNVVDFGDDKTDKHFTAISDDMLNDDSLVADNAVENDAVENDALKNNAVVTDISLANAVQSHAENDMVTQAITDDSAEPAAVEQPAEATIKQTKPIAQTKPINPELQEWMSLVEIPDNAPEDDPDIREIFLEEVEEVLEHIHNKLPVLVNDRADKTALSDVRRGYHTLKGSGRMVGANRVGEFAWHIEDMLNRVIDGSIPLSDDVLALVAAATDTVPSLIEDLEHQTDTVNILPLMASAKSYAHKEGVAAEEAIALLVVNTAAQEADLVATEQPVADETSPVAAHSVVESFETEVLEAETLEIAESETVQTDEHTAVSDSTLVALSDDTFTTHEEDDQLANAVLAGAGLVAASSVAAAQTEPQEGVAENNIVEKDSIAEDSIKAIFIEEAEELLQHIRIYIDANPIGGQINNDLIRALHTLRGSAAMSGLEVLHDLNMAMEHACRHFMENRMDLDAKHIDLLQALHDRSDYHVQIYKQNKPVVSHSVDDTLVENINQMVLLADVGEQQPKLQVADLMALGIDDVLDAEWELESKLYNEGADYVDTLIEQLNKLHDNTRAEIVLSRISEHTKDVYAHIRNVPALQKDDKVQNHLIFAHQQITKVFDALAASQVVENSPDVFNRFDDFENWLAENISDYMSVADVVAVEPVAPAAVSADDSGTQDASTEESSTDASTVADASEVFDSMSAEEAAEYAELNDIDAAFAAFNDDEMPLADEAQSASSVATTALQQNLVQSDFVKPESLQGAATTEKSSLLDHLTAVPHQKTAPVELISSSTDAQTSVITEDDIVLPTDNLDDLSIANDVVSQPVDDTDAVVAADDIVLIDETAEIDTVQPDDELLDENKSSDADVDTVVIDAGVDDTAVDADVIDAGNADDSISIDSTDIDNMSAEELDITDIDTTDIDVTKDDVLDITADVEPETSEPETLELETVELETVELETAAEQPADTGSAADTAAEQIEEDLLPIFLEEAQETLDVVETRFTQWAEKTDDLTALAALQRHLHTIKGGARMIGANRIGDLTHEAESVYEMLAEEKLVASPAILKFMRHIQDMVAQQIEELATDPSMVSVATKELATISQFVTQLDEDILQNFFSEADITVETSALQGDAETEQAAEEQRAPVKAVSGVTSRMDLLTVPATVIAVIEPQAWQPDEQPDEEMLEIFLEEAEEIVGSSSGLFHEWCQNVADLDKLKELQRELHTLKGGARMAGVASVGDLAHEMEFLYEDYALQKKQPVPAVAKLLSQSHDWLAEAVEVLKSGSNPGDAGVLVAPMQAYMKDAENFRIAKFASKDTTGVSVNEAMTGIRQAAPVANDAATQADVTDTLEENLPTASAEATTSAMQAISLDVENEGMNLSELMAKQDSTEHAKHFDMPAMTGDFQADADAEQGSNEMIRVSSSLMEKLINLSGEAVINRGRVEVGNSNLNTTVEEMGATVQRLADQLRRMDIELEEQIRAQYEGEISQYDDFDPLEMDEYSSLNQLSKSLSESASDLLDIKSTMLDRIRESDGLLLQLSRIQTDLQESLMDSRLVPFSRIVPRLQRVVRQTANELQKTAELKVMNADTEIDRTILDRITSPLEHMVRNAVDHGIEQPAERAAAGKPEKGTIILTLTREGGEIFVKIQDDGKGVNVEAVRKKATERGLIHNPDMTDLEIMQFIFHAGLTTKKQVTQISGRGVGMDVVQSEIKQMGGTVTVESEQDKGSEFVMRLPLTVAVSDALIVRAADKNFAIPLVQIERIERVSFERIKNYMLSDEELISINDESFRLHYLNMLINQSEFSENTHQAGMSVPVIIVKTVTGQKQAIFVDELSGSRTEIVVKPLGTQLAKTIGIPAATILGDGSVMLILDLIALMRNAPARRAVQKVDAVQVTERRASLDGKTHVMVIDDSVTVRKVTTRLLERNNFESHTAKDGVDALEKLQEIIPDVMLLDIEMPRMDGFEVATQVRKDPRLQDVPIIMITSRTGEKHRERAFELGVNCYMGKPFQEKELLENIEELLSIANVDAD